MTKTMIIPDQAALARVGNQVRNRLQADPKIYKVPTEKAEIYAVGKFMSGAECTKLMRMIDVVAQPSELFDMNYAAGFRTSYSGNVDGRDPFIKGLSRRIDDLLGMKPECGEPIQGQRYLPGQEFKPHCDWFYTDQDYWKAERKRGGQRCWTAMAFLNPVEKGGATRFTEVGIDIDPQPGVLLVWNNAHEDGSPNLDTTHAGTPVEAGIKYVITKWYRTRKWG